MILKGYIFSRPFLEERVPQHVQNIVIQNYCKNRNYTFQLSATEYRYDESTFILMELLENISKYDGLVFYSLFQLPLNEKKRNFLYNKILKKNKVIHFAAESHVDRSIKDPFSFAQTNVMGTLSLLQAAKEAWSNNYSDKLFYHISTDEVYGSLNQKGLFTETTKYYTLFFKILFESSCNRNRIKNGINRHTCQSRSLI